MSWHFWRKRGCIPGSPMTDLRVVGTSQSIADPSLSRAVGLHHTLPTALADIVDNSLDAGAEHVLIRFVRDGTRITGVNIVDDGSGMAEDAIDAAMTYGHQRDYETGDLGHFGVGMKAASLSQAGALVVWSRAKGGVALRRMIDAGDQAVDRLDDAQAATVLDEMNPRFPFGTGTIVEWKGVTTFLMSADETEQISWLEQTIEDVRTHLGVVFHRKLTRSFRMTVDVFDVGMKRAGAPRKINPIDPFGYPSSGAAEYPKGAVLTLPEGDSPIVAHIWPARSGLPEYRLFGAPGRDSQGLFVYRNDRLLQIGGWNGLWHGRPDFGPARVSIELDDVLAAHVRINPEKAGVVLDATVSAALQLSLSSLSANGYVADAAATTKAARSRTPKPISVLEPASGLPEDVLDSFSDAFSFDDEQEPVSMYWRVLARDKFFEVDLKNRTLWINARFRSNLVGRKSRDSTDAPILKTLLYLLVQQMFNGRQISPRQNEQIQAWQGVLISAMTTHREQTGVDG